MCCCATEGCGYHLDLFIVALMLGVLLSEGLPWFVAATVLSISHRQQSEAGVRVFGAWRTAQVPRDQRAADHRPHDLRPHGLLRIHDLSAEGLEIIFIIVFLCGSVVAASAAQKVVGSIPREHTY